MENTQQATTGKAKRRRVRLYERGTHDDIKYRGPLSYRAFQIIGWICLVITQAVVLATMASKANPDTANHYALMAEGLSWIGAMSLPFLLLASFATMLNHNTSYLMQLVKNFALMLALAAVFYIGIYHFVLGSLSALDPEPGRAERFLEDMIHSSGTGFIAFNVFVDLFLCTLFLFFLCYRPKKLFQGKWVILLRLCAVLPVAYELGCIWWKWDSAKGIAHIPVHAFPFLTVKPPMTFLVFIVLAIYIKVRERHFLKHGKTYEEYQAFLGTNRNSLHFAVFAAVLLLIAGLLDLLFFLDIAAYEVLEMLKLDKLSNITLTQILDPKLVLGATAMGFGNAIQLLLMPPFVLLFSYTRTHKNKLIDIFIPIVGIVLILLVYLQGGYQVIRIMPLPKINLDEITTLLKQVKVVVAGLSLVK
ncbi:MAG: hypothetical protein IJ089_06195 [Clostridia bacterium]|nr:hypothetical protein [Clostridia bacterium]